MVIESRLPTTHPRPSVGESDLHPAIFPGGRIRSPYAPAAAVERWPSPSGLPSDAAFITASMASDEPSRHLSPAVRAASLAVLALSLAAPALAQAAPPPAPTAITMSVAQPVHHTSAFTVNAVEVVSGDDAARARALRLVGSARHSIRLEAAALQGDDAGRLAAVLEQKARQGVTVEVLTEDTSPLVAGLKSAGVTVHSYNTWHLAPGFYRGDHANLIIADDATAMSGSTRWNGEHGQSWDALVQGPAVGDLRALWNESWGGPVEPFQPGPGLLDGTPPAAVRVLSNDPLRQETKETLLANIRAAKDEIFIEAYALNDTDVFNALKAARDRSVEVNVMLNRSTDDFSRLPGDVNNLGAGLAFSQPNDQLSFRWYPSLPDARLRSMVAEFDRTTAIVGNSYWTGRQSSEQHAIDLVISGKDEVSAMKWQMLDDWQNRATFAPVAPAPRMFHQ